MNRLLLLLFLIAVPAFLAAQSGPAYVPGQLLFQAKKVNLPGIESDLQQINRQATGFSITKVVSRQADIWLARFDTSTVSDERILSTLRMHPDVTIAQFNHYVQKRSLTPNDPEYGNQWQYDNDGSNGGTPDGDIDAPEAWDITTGGITALGDTIVVCIIDDGIDLNHEDFNGNLWVNKEEIPDNGIDDDGNGFVDDYRGWNQFLENDDISGGGHGTPVAGIVGARGNNALGVAGINWQVKLMIVNQAFLTEDAVIEAYSYPLGFRQKYNATNGQEGAFVVATNSSWGIDFGQPADAPLWCAFYDTLGAAGILNPSATINGNQDVDVIGDLPTGCASDFMISVTNLDNTDQKVPFAGYGLETIDLGAHGQGTWTTAAGNSYGGFGGTSGATPHVAGAVALLYSIPCTGLAQIAKTNPQMAAEMVREYILEGVDPNSSLEGITVTGGRLNLHNSILLALDACNSLACPTPTDLEVHPNFDQALIDWNGPDTVTYLLQWQAFGDTSWNTINLDTSFFLLENLDTAAFYQVQVAALCPSGDTSLFTPLLPFNTLGTCNIPSGVVFSLLPGDSALVSWNNPDSAIGYLLFLSPADANGDSVFTSTGLSLTLALEACNQYTFQIQSLCLLGDTSALSAPVIIATEDCGACSNLNYCPQAGTNPNLEWLDSLSFAGSTNASGINGGYLFEEGLFAEVNIGDSYDISMTPGFSGTAFNESFQAFIDFNQNGLFEPFEQVFNANANTTVTGTLTIPPQATPGITRMRFIMNFGAAVDGCAPSYSFGETEDYCVRLVPPPGFCAVPSGLETVSVQIFEALLGWEADPDIEYLLRWRTVGAPDWNLIPNASPDIELPDLDNCTEYEFEVAQICETGDTSAYSFPQTFTTLGCCTPPTNPIVFQKDSTSALISWQGDLPNDEAYILEISPANENGDSVFVVSNSLLFLLSDLLPCQAYEVQVSSVCVVGDTLPAPPLDFITNGCGPCLDLDYCEQVAFSTSQWIESLTLKDINNVSGPGPTVPPQGYTLFEDQTTSLVVDSTYTLTLKANGTFIKDLRIWIDFNQDGVFDPILEEVVAVDDITDDLITENITIPGNAPFGLTRMRASLRAFSIPEPCSDFSFTGEVEDYCITIAPKFTPCVIPDSVVLIDTTPTQALFQWSQPTENTIGYSVRYREAGTSMWEEFTTISPFFTIEPLDSCTAYQVQVRTICEEDVSGFSDTLLIETPCVPVSTQSATGLQASLEVYPNPFHTQLMYSLELPSASAVEVHMMDMSGRRVGHQSLGSLSGGKYILEFPNVSTLPAGMYILQLQHALGTTQKQVIKK